MRLLDAVRNAARRLEADFADSELFEHRGDRGEFREDVIKRFLRPFLQSCYGLGSGMIFSQDGASSKQIDIVVYDTVFSNVLFRDGNNSLFPCESVYGTIEVKSRLTTDELTASFGNVASVKQLARAPSDVLDFTPLRRLELGSGLTYNKSIRNPYLGIIFGFDGLTSESVYEFLQSYLHSSTYQANELPDYIFCLRQGYTVLRMQVLGGKAGAAPLDTPMTGYIVYPTGNDTLPLFYLTLNACLNQIQLRGADINAYWRAVVTEMEGIQNSEIVQIPPRVVHLP